jgi:hypothetical protein
MFASPPKLATFTSSFPGEFFVKETLVTSSVSLVFEVISSGKLLVTLNGFNRLIFFSKFSYSGLKSV